MKNIDTAKIATIGIALILMMPLAFASEGNGGFFESFFGFFSGRSNDDIAIEDAGNDRTEDFTNLDTVDDSRRSQKIEITTGQAVRNDIRQEDRRDDGIFDDQRREDRREDRFVLESFFADFFSSIGHGFNSIFGIDNSGSGSVNSNREDNSGPGSINSNREDDDGIHQNRDRGATDESEIRGRESENEIRGRDFEIEGPGDEPRQEDRQADRQNDGINDDNSFGSDLRGDGTLEDTGSSGREEDRSGSSGSGS